MVKRACGVEESELIPGLPSELVRTCILARVPWMYFRCLRLVSRAWEQFATQLDASRIPEGSLVLVVRGVHTRIALGYCDEWFELPPFPGLSGVRAPSFADNPAWELRFGVFSSAGSLYFCVDRAVHVLDVIRASHWHLMGELPCEQRENGEVKCLTVLCGSLVAGYVCTGRFELFAWDEGNRRWSFCHGQETGSTRVPELVALDDTGILVFEEDHLLLFSALDCPPARVESPAALFHPRGGMKSYAARRSTIFVYDGSKVMELELDGLRLEPRSETQVELPQEAVAFQVYSGGYYFLVAGRVSSFGSDLTTQLLHLFCCSRGGVVTERECPVSKVVLEGVYGDLEVDDMPFESRFCQADRLTYKLLST